MIITYICIEFHVYLPLKGKFHEISAQMEDFEYRCFAAETNPFGIETTGRAGDTYS